MRALDGDLTGCIRALQSGKPMLASSSPEVAGEWREKVTVEGRRPTRPWQEPARAQGFDTGDPCFAFDLGTSKVMGTGGPIEVSTLVNVMGHLQKRIPGGADGTGINLYPRIDASSVKSFVLSFFSPPSALEEGGTSG